MRDSVWSNISISEEKKSLSRRRTKNSSHLDKDYSATSPQKQQETLKMSFKKSKHAKSHGSKHRKAIVMQADVHQLVFKHI